MKKFNPDTCILIPRVWEVTPLLPHAYISNDKIYHLYKMERNWNEYYSPSCGRLNKVRKMSGRNVLPIKRRSVRMDRA